MMSGSNVGLGMVECKPNCKCDECVIMRQRKQIRELQAQLQRLVELVSDIRCNPHEDYLYSGTMPSVDWCRQRDEALKEKDDE